MVSVPGYGRPGKSNGKLNGQDRYELGSTAWATALRTRYGACVGDNGNPSYAGCARTSEGSLAGGAARGGSQDAREDTGGGAGTFVHFLYVEYTAQWISVSEPPLIGSER